MTKDWIFSTNHSVCDLRAVGVLIRDNKLLVQRDRDGNEYALPGGHVQIGETTEAALIREFKEETDAHIRCVRLLWTEECFWAWKGKQAHNISFYYSIEFCQSSDLPDSGEFLPHKDNPNVLIGWMPIDELQNLTVYPSFLKEEIFRWDDAPRHFVSKY